MRLGFALPQIGLSAGPDNLVTVAQRAEVLGFDSLWVPDRLLFPVNPRLPYPVGDGSLLLREEGALGRVTLPEALSE